MKEQYKQLDLNNRNKWDIIRNQQPKDLSDYTSLDLNGKQWVSLKNPEIWKPIIEERREESMETRSSRPYAQTGETAVIPSPVEHTSYYMPVLMPYQSVMDVEPISPPKPDRMKKAERQGAPTRKERHALRDLAAGRQVAPKIDEERLTQLLEQRVQQEPLPLEEGLQALDTAKQRVVGEVIVDFTK
jgi:hypothetical protein